MEQNGILIALVVLLIGLGVVMWMLIRVATAYDSLAKECEQMHRLCRELILRTEPTKKIRAGVAAKPSAEPAKAEIPAERPASMASLRAMAESSMTEEQARARRVEKFNG